jgi:NADPH-dependent ferric siderophore reductase
MTEIGARIRREPPTFRAVTVAHTTDLTPHLRRVTLHGPALAGLDPGLPAASVRVLLPSPGTADLIVPRWEGNEFLLAGGRRPIIRTYTPRRFDTDALELDIDVVLHPDGVAAAWATTVQPGEPAAVSGTGRGYAIDPSATTFLLGGDEAAVPAISVLLESLPPAARVDVMVEVGHADARLALPSHPGATIAWLDRSATEAHGAALEAAVRRATVDPAARVWVAGEAAAVQRIRRHLFDERGLARSQCTVRGYWKHGRAGGADDA